MRRTLSLAVLLALGLSSSPAFAAHFSLVGAITKSTATDSSSNTWSSNGYGMGGGALLEFSDIELGALYIDRAIERDNASVTETADLKGIELPLGLRFWMANVFSVGAGGYYLHYLSSGSATGSDIGAYGSVAIRLPLGLATGLLIDGRYNYGFKDSTGDVTAKAQDLQGLVGLVFGM